MSLELKAEPLYALAKSRNPVDREQLLARLVDFCEARPDTLAPSAAQEVEEIFLCLVGEAERDIRARLAERLARADWPPARLIETLAQDDIEVARPVIAASPLLKDEALIRLLTRATLAHHIEVAQRPRLSAQVVEAVLHGRSPAARRRASPNSGDWSRPGRRARCRGAGAHVPAGSPVPRARGR